MSMRTRRELLADVGKGMFLASLGAARREAEPASAYRARRRGDKRIDRRGDLVRHLWLWYAGHQPS